MVLGCYVDQVIVFKLLGLLVWGDLFGQQYDGDFDDKQDGVDVQEVQCYLVGEGEF